MLAEQGRALTAKDTKIAKPIFFRVLCGLCRELLFVAFQRFAGEVIERVSQHAKHND